MTTAAELALLLTAKDQATPVVQALQRNVATASSQITASAETAAKSISSGMDGAAKTATGSLQSLASSAQQSFNSIQQGAQKAASTVASSFREAEAASKGLLLGATAAAAGLIGIGVEAVQTAGRLEQTRMAYQNLLGSAQAGNAMLKDLTNFAANTPFQIPQIQQAGQQLLAMNFSAAQVIPTLKALGDAAAGLGRGNEGLQRLIFDIGEMNTLGTVSSRQMMMLSMNGVSAWNILADGLHESVAKVKKDVEEGLISSAKAIPMLLAGIEKGPLANAMQTQMQTLLGMVSNMKDRVIVIMGAVGTELIEALHLKDVVAAVSIALTQITDLIDQKGLQGALQTLFPPDLQTKIEVVAGAIAGALVPALTAMAISAGSALLALAPFALAGAAIAYVASQTLDLGAAWSNVQAAAGYLRDRVTEMGQALNDATQYVKDHKEAQVALAAAFAFTASAAAAMAIPPALAAIGTGLTMLTGAAAATALAMNGFMDSVVIAVMFGSTALTELATSVLGAAGATALGVGLIAAGIALPVAAILTNFGGVRDSLIDLGTMAVLIWNKVAFEMVQDNTMLNEAFHEAIAGILEALADFAAAVPVVGATVSASLHQAAVAADAEAASLRVAMYDNQQSFAVANASAIDNAEKMRLWANDVSASFAQAANAAAAYSGQALTTGVILNAIGSRQKELDGYAIPAAPVSWGGNGGGGGALPKGRKGAVDNSASQAAAAELAAIKEEGAATVKAAEAAAAAIKEAGAAAVKAAEANVKLAEAAQKEAEETLKGWERATTAVERYRDMLLKLADAALGQVKPAFAMLFDQLHGGAGFGGVSATIATIGNLLAGATTMAGKAVAADTQAAAVAASRDAAAAAVEAAKANTEAVKANTEAVKNAAAARDAAAKDATEAVKAGVDARNKAAEDAKNDYKAPPKNPAAAAAAKAAVDAAAAGAVAPQAVASVHYRVMSADGGGTTRPAWTPPVGTPETQAITAAADAAMAGLDKQATGLQGTFLPVLTAVNSILAETGNALLQLQGQLTDGYAAATVASKGFMSGADALAALAASGQSTASAIGMMRNNTDALRASLGNLTGAQRTEAEILLKAYDGLIAQAQAAGSDAKALAAVQQAAAALSPELDKLAAQSDALTNKRADSMAAYLEKRLGEVGSVTAADWSNALASVARGEWVDAIKKGLHDAIARGADPSAYLADLARATADDLARATADRIAGTAAAAVAKLAQAGQVGGAQLQSALDEAAQGEWAKHLQEALTTAIRSGTDPAGILADLTRLGVAQRFHDQQLQMAKDDAAAQKQLHLDLTKSWEANLAAQSAASLAHWKQMTENAIAAAQAITSTFQSLTPSGQAYAAAHGGAGSVAPYGGTQEGTQARIEWEIAHQQHYGYGYGGQAGVPATPGASNAAHMSGGGYHVMSAGGGGAPAINVTLRVDSRELNGIIGRTAGRDIFDLARSGGV